MEKFEEIKIDLITFLQEDVITTSGAYTSNAIYDEDATLGSLEDMFGLGSN